MKTLYRILRIIGDAKAISRGKYPLRVVRRSAHRSLSKGLRKIMK